MQPGWGSLLWFAAIVALIPVALWLLKRTPLGGAFGSAAQAGVPRAVAVLPLSAQHKVVTMEVGTGEERLWLVVGVSPQGLRTLHTMAALGEPPEAHPTAAPQAAFAQLLSRMRQASSGRDDGPGSVR
jgi:flagellar protein FliO/FliZ